jgi:predicted CoA-binding protein
MNVKDSEIPDLLRKYKKMTVLGLSPDATKPSQKVPLFMRSHGYEVAGVYPGQENIAGFKIYGSLAEVPDSLRKFVDVFRRVEHIPAVVDEVLALGGVEVLWLQLGIRHPEAEARAEKAGLKVVADRCLHIELAKFV